MVSSMLCRRHHPGALASLAGAMLALGGFPAVTTASAVVTFPSAFRCGGQRLSVTHAGDDARLRIGPRLQNLTQVRSASGARFQDPDDPGTWIWSKGVQMTVSLAGTPLPPCQPIRSEIDADRPMFRASGNEPGWAVLMEGKELTLTTDNGASRRTAPLPQADLSQSGRRYEVASLGAIVTVADSLCRDTMAGPPRPAMVTLELEGRTLQGCGGEPLDLLVGEEWTVETIDDKPVSGERGPSLLFEADGRVAGSGGCNRWMGSFAIGGEGATFGQAASTMMACTPERMALEQRFLQALARVDGVDVDPEGRLLLTASEKPLIRARLHPRVASHP